MGSSIIVAPWPVCTPFQGSTILEEGEGDLDLDGSERERKTFILVLITWDVDRESRFGLCSGELDRDHRFELYGEELDRDLFVWLYMYNGELDRDQWPELSEEPDRDHRFELNSGELERDHFFRLWNGDVIGETLLGLASGEKFTELDVDESGFLGWWYANLSSECECFCSSMGNGSRFSNPVSKQYMGVDGISGRL